MSLLDNTETLIKRSTKDTQLALWGKDLRDFYVTVKTNRTDARKSVKLDKEIIKWMNPLIEEASIYAVYNPYKTEQPIEKTKAFIIRAMELFRILSAPQYRFLPTDFMHKIWSMAYEQTKYGDRYYDNYDSKYDQRLSAAGRTERYIAEDEWYVIAAAMYILRMWEMIHINLSYHEKDLNTNQEAMTIIEQNGSRFYDMVKRGETNMDRLKQNIWSDARRFAECGVRKNFMDGNTCPF